MLKLKKVYTVSAKNKKPRFFLQHLVCEAANWKQGIPLYVSVDEEKQEITIQSQPMSDQDHLVHVSSRVSKTTGVKRPLLDTAGERYGSIIGVRQKVEINVYSHHSGGKVVIRPLRFNLMEIIAKEPQHDERISLLSIGAGCGIGSSIFEDSGYFKSVMEVEMEDDSCEVLQRNFPHAFLFNGDLRDCGQVLQSDVGLVTLGCNEYSSLGQGEEGTFTNVVLATANILKAASPRICMFENVPEFYESRSWALLKSLLKYKWSYWKEKNMESYDFWGIARRNRTYVVCFQNRSDFDLFEFPTSPPRLRRRKLKDFLDPKGTQHEWKDLSKWMASFKAKREKGNSWKDRSLAKTFLTEDAKEIASINKRYRSQCASNSYLLNQTKDSFRFFTVSELRRIMGIPEWFDFGHTALNRVYEMIGQSVCGRVFRSLANEIASVFFKSFFEDQKTESKEIMSLASDGQFELCF